MEVSETMCEFAMYPQEVKEEAARWKRRNGKDPEELAHFITLPVCFLTCISVLSQDQLRETRYASF